MVQLVHDYPKAQVAVEMSVTHNSLSGDYSHPNNHTRQTKVMLQLTQWDGPVAYTKPKVLRVNY